MQNLTPGPSPPGESHARDQSFEPLLLDLRISHINQYVDNSRVSGQNSTFSGRPEPLSGLYHSIPAPNADHCLQPLLESMHLTYYYSLPAGYTKTRPRSTYHRILPSKMINLRLTRDLAFRISYSRRSKSIPSRTLRARAVNKWENVPAHASPVSNNDTAGGKYLHT